MEPREVVHEHWVVGKRVCLQGCPACAQLRLWEWLKANGDPEGLLDDGGLFLSAEAVAAIDGVFEARGG